MAICFGIYPIFRQTHVAVRCVSLPMVIIPAVLPKPARAKDPAPQVGQRGGFRT